MNADPFEPRPHASYPTLERISEPPHRVLAEFVQGCSPNANARTIAVTTLVISLWQLAGRGMTHRAPSLILVDATGAFPDMIDVFAARLVKDNGDNGPRVHREGAFMMGEPKGAPAVMTHAIIQKQKLGKPTEHNHHQRGALEARFFAAQATGFGTGRARAYSKAWHDTFGLLTDRNNEVILRIESADDRAALRQHLLKDTTSLTHPIGYGIGLVPVTKHIAISGSLDLSQWDKELVTKMVQLGLPFVFLPHACEEPPALKNLPALDVLTMILPNAFSDPLEEPANLLPDDWSEPYARHLRERLRELPGDYEYVIQRMARQLFPVCSRLALWTGRRSGASDGECEALALDLYGHTLRGLVIGVAGLAWHGLGFDTGIPRDEVVKVLKYLRDKGPTTKSDLTRYGKVEKADREILLPRFVAENLVRVEGNIVTAATYAEFVEALYARKEFPEPVNYWKQVAKADAPAA